MHLAEGADRPRERGAKRVTIDDLAKAVGLTKGTVSRALNGYPDIAVATRQRIEAMAERLGYQPLGHAQAMTTGRTRSIGLVLQTGEHDAHRPFLAEFLAGISEAASTANWSLTIATAETDADVAERMTRLIAERKADGFILPRTRHRDYRIAMLRAHDVPFVLFGRTGDDTGCAWFDILGEVAMAEAVAHLSALGHRRIGFVNGGTEYNYARLRRQGYLQGLADLGQPVDPALMRSGAMDKDAGEAQAGALLDLPDPPTAIVFGTDGGAMGAWPAAAARGLAVGRDLAVIGYDGIPQGAWTTPPLSTFAVDVRGAGSRLAEMLIARIRGAAPEGLRQTGRARLIDRGSACAAPRPTPPNHA